MDLIPAGSRGALRLHPGARPSRNDANIGVLPSQRWTFQSDQTCRDARFATSPLTTSSGISHSATLTPATALASSATRSLYPATDDEASASIDADILAAQRFLRSHQPDIEIPDYILAQVFDESARDIHERGCSLDGGAIGLADAQAVALLGPLALPDKRVYAVACIGGSHRNLLLVHQLQVNAPSQDDSAFAVQTSEAEASTRALPELPSTQTDALRFIPAHQAQQTFATPILQIVASSDRMQLAVRTHSATTFFSLGPPDASALQDGPQLHPIHHARFGQDGSTQHHDVVFSPYTPNTAAAVDRAGNITMYRLPACNPDSRSSEPESSSTDASAPPPPSSASRSAEWRKHAQPSQTSPQSAALPVMCDTSTRAAASSSGNCRQTRATPTAPRHRSRYKTNNLPLRDPFASRLAQQMIASSYSLVIRSSVSVWKARMRLRMPHRLRALLPSFSRASPPPPSVERALSPWLQHRRNHNIRSWPSARPSRSTGSTSATNFVRSLPPHIIVATIPLWP